MCSLGSHGHIQHAYRCPGSRLDTRRWAGFRGTSLPKALNPKLAVLSGGERVPRRHVAMSADISDRGAWAMTLVFSQKVTISNARSETAQICPVPGFSLIKERG